MSGATIEYYQVLSRGSPTMGNYRLLWCTIPLWILSNAINHYNKILVLLMAPVFIVTPCWVGEAVRESGPVGLDGWVLPDDIVQNKRCSKRWSSAMKDQYEGQVLMWSESGTRAHNLLKQQLLNNGQTEDWTQAPWICARCSTTELSSLRVSNWIAHLISTLAPSFRLTMSVTDCTFNIKKYLDALQPMLSGAKLPVLRAPSYLVPYQSNLTEHLNVSETWILCTQVGPPQKAWYKKCNLKFNSEILATLV